MSKPILALVDGDELLYKVCFASQHVWYYVYPKEGLDKEEWVSKYKYKKQAIEYIGNDAEMHLEPVIEYESEKFVLNRLRAAYKTIMKDTKAADSRVFLTGSNNFRKEIATIQVYKGNRANLEKPYYYNFVRKVLIDEYFSEVVDDYEADDAMSIHQTYNNFIEEPFTTIIACQDKDLDMVPGMRYNPSKRVIFDINPYNAMLSFYIQLLTGDNSTDFILGLKGIGKAGAIKALREATEASEEGLIEIVKGMYHKKQSSFPRLSVEEAITETGRLLWMQQHEGQLWEIGRSYYDNYI